uniref:Uncharacterized protein n=1 Tax=Oryza brachyantha TaxID=4533 RepID=J3NCJ3_ORYBR
MSMSMIVGLAVNMSRLNVNVRVTKKINYSLILNVNGEALTRSYPTKKKEDQY